LRFLVDAQLPPALARWIVSAGHAAEHVGDCGLMAAPDDVIRTRASQTGAVILTKDEDFAVHRLLHEGPAIVWVRIGNTRRAELLRRIEVDFPAIVAALERGEPLVEIA
jgi:predicted nuclease of predicted toxin-antitoxin system